MPRGRAGTTRPPARRSPVPAAAAVTRGTPGQTLAPGVASLAPSLSHVSPLAAAPFHLCGRPPLIFTMCVLGSVLFAFSPNQQNCS